MSLRLAIIALLSCAIAQESIHVVSRERVTLRRMREVPAVDVAPGVHVRTVVGTTGSFSVGEFEAG